MHQTIYGTASCCALKMVSTSCRSSRSRPTSEARSVSSPPCGDIAYLSTFPTLSTRRHCLRHYRSLYRREPCPSDRRELRSRQPEVRGMDRRAFVTGLGAVLAAPLAGEAQLVAMVSPRLGFLGNSDSSTEGALLNGFRQGLQDFGLIEGQTIT